MEKNVAALRPGEDLIIEGGGIVEVVEVVREAHAILVRAKTAPDIVQDFVYGRTATVRTNWTIPLDLAHFRRALAVAVREVNAFPTEASMASGVEAPDGVEPTAAEFATILGYVDNVGWEGMSAVVDAWRDIEAETGAWPVPADQLLPTAWWNAMGDYVHDAIEEASIAWLRAYAFPGLRGKARASRLAEALPNLAKDVRRWVAQAR